MPKLLFTTSSFNLDNFHDRSLIEKAGFEFVFNPYARRLTEGEISSLMDEDVVGMVAGTEPLTQSVINKAKSLKVISRCGIGLDNVDLRAANEQGISVYNTPNAPIAAVAELTVGHIFSLARRIVESDRNVHSEKWKPIMGRLVSHQTIGLLGFGRVGKAVAQRLSALGAKILAYDKIEMSTKLDVQLVGFEQLIKESDIISLHLPYEPSTHHIIDAHALRQIKPTAQIINVSRGGLIDEIALASALKEKRLAGAALDCFEQEPYFGPLLSFDNVQITAHMGSYAQETRAIMEAESCVSLVDGLRKHGLISN